MRTKISRLEKLEGINRRQHSDEWDATWEAAFAGMTDDELRAVVSGSEKGKGDLTEFERASMQKFDNCEARRQGAA